MDASRLNARFPQRYREEYAPLGVDSLLSNDVLPQAESAEGQAAVIKLLARRAVALRALESLFPMQEDHMSWPDRF